MIVRTPLFICSSVSINKQSVVIKYSITNNQMLANGESAADINIQQTINQNTQKSKAYQKTNAYTLKPSFQQIVTFFMFIAHLAMHCVFIIRPILGIDHPILYVMWGFYWLTVVVIGHDYLLLTCGDPVDELVAHPENLLEYRIKCAEFDRKHQINRNVGITIPNDNNPYKLRQCKVCKKVVLWKSYHCWTCKRCVQDMDHHCKYLNNCIGSKNYFPFFRILSIVSAYFVVSIGIGVWVFVRSFALARIDELSFSKWAVLVWIILSVLCLIIVQILLWFHCYISCCKRMTTVEYLFRDTSSNDPSSDGK